MPAFVALVLLKGTAIVRAPRLVWGARGGRCRLSEGEPMSYDGVIGAVLPFLLFLANLAGGLVIGVALVRGLLVYLRALIRRRGEELPSEAIRLSLGRSLALALEFQLAADILKTALDPTREDLIILAVIASLRTALNYFLGRELDDVQGSTSSLAVPSASRVDASPGQGTG